MARFAGWAVLQPSRTADLPWLHLVVGALVVLVVLVAGALGVTGPAPSKAMIPIADGLSSAIAAFVTLSRGVFRPLSGGLAWWLDRVQAGLIWLPWPVVILLCGAVGFVAGGRRLALFCSLTLSYVVVTGYWERTAVTLSLVAVAVPVSVATGLLLGILAFRSRLAWRTLEPVLDLMQTIPTLAYLLPILAIFGIGPMVGVVASAIYAAPPMVRAVVHGLQRVPPEITESGVMFGSTKTQLLVWVLVPSSMPTILLGLNQTIMAGLSMVVIASMVGGVSDIGIEVYQTMKQAKFGESVLVGFVIALLAMVLDRVSRSIARRDHITVRGMPWRALVALGAAAAACVAVATAVPGVRSFPENWVVRPAPLIDAALDWFTRAAFPVTSVLKTWTVYYVLLPLKIGLPQSIRPSVWGFQMSSIVTSLYLIIVLSVILIFAWHMAWKQAATLAIFSIFYYFGVTGTPWLLTIALLSSIGYSAGGWRVALLALGATGFVLVTGGWTRAMVSLELCAVGVLCAFLLGSAIGFWAAANDRVSAAVRPVCDTLQTMPIFVFLIPAVMVFLVGEFTALIAIVLYSIVPAIRYAELGIRSVPGDLTEAARMMGVTRRQMRWQIHVPVALPEIALGLNQTIMMALSMVVIASLVGAPGLGQDVMLALSEGDAGGGLVAGLSIALIAITFDRIIQSWSDRKKASLGLAMSGRAAPS